jgi:hypothetical protein
MTHALPFHQWALAWVSLARQVPQGEVVAGLLVDLAADPREAHASPTVEFPLKPAARALRVSPAVLRRALHRLAVARLVEFRVDQLPGGPLVTVTVLHPEAAAERGLLKG